MPKQLTIAQLENAQVSTEILAQSIVAISQGIKRLRAGKLNDKALYLLIQQAAPLQRPSSTRISLNTIRDVIEGLESLERTYIRKPAPGGR